MKLDEHELDTIRETIKLHHSDLIEKSRSEWDVDCLHVIVIGGVCLQCGEAVSVEV